MILLFVNANSVNAFKNRVDKYWANEELQLSCYIKSRKLEVLANKYLFYRAGYSDIDLLVLCLCPDIRSCLFVCFIFSPFHIIINSHSLYSLLSSKLETDHNSVSVSVSASKPMANAVSVCFRFRKNAVARVSVLGASRPGQFRFWPKLKKVVLVGLYSKCTKTLLAPCQDSL